MKFIKIQEYSDYFYIKGIGFEKIFNNILKFLYILKYFLLKTQKFNCFWETVQSRQFKSSDHYIKPQFNRTMALMCKFARFLTFYASQVNKDDENR